MEKIRKSNENMNLINKLKISSLGIMAGIIAMSTTFAVAAEYVSLEIEPKNLGLFYQNETTKFKAVAKTASGAYVDVTNEVDWYIDPAGYPANSTQDLTDGAVATIDTTGKITVHDTWGRVVVYACYPKGCAPGSSKVITSVIGALLRPSYAVTGAVDGSGGTITPSPQSVRNGNKATFTLTPDTDNEASIVVGGCATGTLSSDKLSYTTGSITEDCTATVAFTTKPQVSSTVSGGASSIDPVGANYVLSGRPVIYTLTPDTGYEILLANISDNCGVSNGAAAILSTDKTTYTTESIDATCTVDFTFTVIPTFEVTSSVTGPNLNGTVSLDGTHNYPENQPAVFTLSPDSGYVAALDTAGDTCTGTAVGFSSDKLTYTTANITADCAVTFKFDAVPTHDVTSSVTGPNSHGTVSLDGVNSYPEGQPAVFTLSPDADYISSLVSDGCAGGGAFSNGNLTYTTDNIVGDCAVVFEFNSVTYSMTVVINNTGSAIGGVTSEPVGAIACPEVGGIDCNNDYNPGETVTLRPGAALGEFKNWTGCTGDNTNAPDITVTMSADQTCTANFGNVL